MGILNKLFVQRKQPKSSDNFNVVIKTEKNLSKEQKDTIISIVKKGISSETEPYTIAINIMTATGIYTPILLNRNRSGVEIII